MTSDGSLKVTSVDIDLGYDSNGHYNEHSFQMNTADKDVGMMAFIRVYERRQFAVFRQHFYPVYDQMSVGDRNKVSTAFPSVKVPPESKSQYINPCKHMAGWYARKGDWDQKNITDMCGGVEGGPFFIYDRTNMTTGYLGQLFALSSFTKHTAFTAEPSSELGEVWFGLPGTTDTLPSNGYDIETIISYSDKGFYEGEYFSYCFI